MNIYNNRNLIMKETAQELEYLQIEEPFNKIENIIPEEIHKKYFVIKKKL